jgi:hypothetical protein
MIGWIEYRRQTVGEMNRFKILIYRGANFFADLVVSEYYDFAVLTLKTFHRFRLISQNCISLVNIEESNPISYG